MKFTKLMAPFMVGAMVLPTIAVQAAEDGYTEYTGETEAIVPINGEIMQTVISFTVPTETTFTIDPNLEAGQQFVAPNFNIINDSNSPLTVGVMSFAQTSKAGTTETIEVDGEQVEVTYANFTDMMPGDIDSWETLGRKDSAKYLALALDLLPTLSEDQTNNDWLVSPTVSTLIDGTEYVLSTSEADDNFVYAKEVQDADGTVLLGVVSPHENRYLSLTASHGLAFQNAVKSQYNVTFVFNLFDELTDLAEVNGDN